jgi:hypothetical protein
VITKRRDIKSKHVKQVSVEFSKATWSVYYFCSAPGAIFQFLFLGCSVAGLLVNPAFYSFHLAMLIKNESEIRYVLKSVTDNIGQLVAALVLAIIILFWYSFVAFSVDDFRGKYGFEEKMVCDTLLSCFQTHFDYGLTVNPFWFDDVVPTSGILFNMSFFILVNLILTSVIGAVIIDTFSQMRQHSLVIKEDTFDRCFI